MGRGNITHTLGNVQVPAGQQQQLGELRSQALTGGGGVSGEEGGHIGRGETHERQRGSKVTCQ